jgi:hypothetical protein
MGRPGLGRVATAVNWRYAVGEIALIVIGIFIALQASAWWDDLAERRIEETYLAELLTELAHDREQVSDGLHRYRRIEADVEELLTILRSGQPYEASFDALFGTAYGTSGFFLSAAAYESLKSRGLVLIADGELRSRIAQIHEETYPRLRLSIQSEATLILDLMRPYFLIHFRDLRFNVSATPLNYAALVQSTEFLNLIDYRLQLTRQNQISVFEQSLAEIDELIAALEAELSN